MVAATVLVERDASTATLTLNRAERLNAIDATMAAELEQAITACARDASIRVVILTGAGAGFCAGGDLKTAAEAVSSNQDPGPLFAEITARLHRTVLALRRMPQPVIAALNGAVSGIGLSLAAATDLRLASEAARFKAAYIGVGLTPDGGWTATVARLVGPARAAELLLLDRPFDARRALELGLVHEVWPAEELSVRAKERAAELARCAPEALAAAKRLLDEALFPDLEAIMEREREVVVARSRSPEFRARLAAFLATQAERRGRA
jgi:2-(1,2-epoxy-1,2-dihydrophenyl)acetyl-CoA isomerase